MENRRSVKTFGACIPNVFFWKWTLASKLKTGDYDLLWRVYCSPKLIEELKIIAPLYGSRVVFNTFMSELILDENYPFQTGRNLICKNFNWKITLYIALNDLSFHQLIMVPPDDRKYA